MKKHTPAKPSADADRKRRRDAADAKKWRLLQAARLLDEYRRTVKGGE